MEDQSNYSPDQNCPYQMRSQLSVSRTESSNFWVGTGETSIDRKISSQFNKHFDEFNKIVDNKLEQHLCPINHKLDLLLYKFEELMINKRDKKPDSNGLSIISKELNRLESIEKNIELVHQTTEKLFYLKDHETKQEKIYLNEQKDLGSEKGNEDTISYLTTSKFDIEISNLLNKLDQIAHFCKIGIENQGKNEGKLKLIDEKEISTNFKLISEKISPDFNLKNLENSYEDLQRVFREFKENFNKKVISLGELINISIKDRIKTQDDLVNQIYMETKKVEFIKVCEWDSEGQFQNLLASLDSYCELE